MAGGLTKDDIQYQLTEDLALGPGDEVLAHVRLEALGPVDGGTETVVDALLAATGTLVMPAFTYQTQVIPQAGPPDNAIVYGSGDEQNARAEFFRPDLPVHPDVGLVAEELRLRPDTLRSLHPILSFVAQGDRARAVLAAQSKQNPLGPIASLEARGGYVLLMGLDQRHNYALHLAEQRAGRKTFVRWALTLDDIEELPRIPGCMEGFNAIWADLMDFARVTQIGAARCERLDLRGMLAYTEQRLQDDPNFMLCDKPSCASCRAREV